MTKQLVAAVVVLASVLAHAQVRGEIRVAARPGGGEAGGGGTVGLPYSQADNAGNQWIVYQGGMLQHRGNQPLFSQAAMLTINGQHAQDRTNQARLDGETGELIFDKLTGNGFEVSRRILFDREAGYVRYVDVVTNTGANVAKFNILLQSQVNFGIQSATAVRDPKRDDRFIGWSAMTHANRGVAELFAGIGSKLPVTVTVTQQNNWVQATFPVEIKPGEMVAFMHVHTTVASEEAGVQWLQKLDTRPMLRSLPKEIRRALVNFPVSESLIAGVEVLRGDVLDVIELRGGDQVRGTIRQPVFALQTEHGPIELPGDQVIAMISVGQHRPRQLLVTAEGQIFGGSLAGDAIDLELSSGQITRVPLSQINRFGMRKRMGEPEEWALTQPMVSLRSGDRMEIEVPAGELEVATRYGRLMLPAGAVQAILFQPENPGAHEIRLVDGSSFAGLLVPEQMQFTLSGLPARPSATLATSSLSVLQLNAPPEDMPDDLPVLTLDNGDVFVGVLSGEIKLDTAFDTLSVNGPEVMALARSGGGPSDLQVTLWDGTTLGGQVRGGTLTCHLKSGPAVAVPVALVAEYENPLPQPSSPMIEQIRQLVVKLNDEDFKQREQAQRQLIGMGIAVAGILSEMRDSQPPEARSRIDQIIEAVKK